MTGIERLREFVAGISSVTVVNEVTKASYDMEHNEVVWACLRDFLSDIADQIEREQDKVAMTDWEAVRDVRDDMARHVSGIPEFDDLVDEWVRKLDDAFDGRERRDPAADVSVSAYDLLPDEDREAIAWVREHGGLDAVKKLLDWVVGHCSTRQQLDFDFWLSGRVMYELGFDEDMADRDEVGRRLLARLMPEGYEWPRYESGEPLRYEDRYVYDGREREVWHVDFDSYGEPTILNKDGTRFHPDKGERVERPAPKVLDADGAEVHKGDEVWSTTGEFAGKRTVSSVHVDPGEPPYAMFEERQKPYSCLCCYLTHRAPVLAADGEPLEVGQTVWDTKGNGPYIIKKIENDGVVRIEGSDLDYFGSEFVHERPDTRARVIDGMDEETVERIDRLVKDGRWLDD